MDGVYFGIRWPGITFWDDLLESCLDDFVCES